MGSDDCLNGGHKRSNFHWDVGHEFCLPTILSSPPSRHIVELQCPVHLRLRRGPVTQFGQEMQVVFWGQHRGVGGTSRALNNLLLILFLSTMTINCVPIGGYFFFFNLRENTWAPEELRPQRIHDGQTGSESRNAYFVVFHHWDSRVVSTEPPFTKGNYCI